MYTTVLVVGYHIIGKQFLGYEVENKLITLIYNNLRAAGGFLGIAASHMRSVLSPNELAQ